MKQLILTTLIVLGGFAQSQAKEVCGLLTKEARGPVCNAGEICPRWMALEYFLSNDSGKFQVGAVNQNVLSDFAQDEGQKVCVFGAMNRQSGDFLVTSISLSE